MRATEGVRSPGPVTNHIGNNDNGNGVAVADADVRVRCNTGKTVALSACVLAKMTQILGPVIS
jgi:hypothetical protein